MHICSPMSGSIATGMKNYGNLSLI